MSLRVWNIGYRIATVTELCWRLWRLIDAFFCNVRPNYDYEKSLLHRLMVHVVKSNQLTITIQRWISLKYKFLFHKSTYNQEQVLAFSFLSSTTNKGLVYIYILFNLYIYIYIRIHFRSLLYSARGELKKAGYTLPVFIYWFF